MYETEVEDHVKMWLYRDIFGHDFNLSFGPPCADSCATYDGLAAQLSDLDLQDVQRSKLLTQKEMHVCNADSGYKYLNADIKKSKDTSAPLEVLTFNMQQTLPVIPQSFSGILPETVMVCSCVLHQLFIHGDVGGKGKRGSSDVASATLKVLNELRKKTILPVNELILWSNGSTGQNKNFFIVVLWSYTIQKGFASKIRHIFLVSGHTFLPCDRDFSHIGKMKRTHINEIHTSEDWIQQSARHEKPFFVLPMKRQ
ncbi:hypothetical protein PR048_002244 [Dryococelus australis]|uniref:DUF7869 domain-containing protein n=1 Tax=Dryococelus australis TaxID=614101 RepID=A0ABQ9IJN3_9NEOP|nr:hypothetical protein PR048_002244 [Dryococelus australis]